MFLISQQSWKH